MGKPKEVSYKELQYQLLAVCSTGGCFANKQQTVANELETVANKLCVQTCEQLRGCLNHGCAEQWQSSSAS